MRAISYNRELRLANEQMMMLFSNIIIDKNLYTSNDKLKGCKKRKYVVKVVFGQESKSFKQLKNSKASELVLPLVSIVREGLIARDDSRVANVNYHAVMGSNAATWPKKDVQGNINPRDPYYDAETPQPVTLKYRVTFYTRDPNEMDIFMGNVAISFNKDVWVRTPHPKIGSLALEHQVIWDGQFTTQWEPDRLKETDIDIMTCTTNFEYKTEFFGGTNMLKENDASGIVEKIVFDTTVPGDKSPYDEFVADEYNNAGGFYCVPLTKEFDDFEAELNERLMEKPDGDFLSFGVYNGILNEGVLNNELDTIQLALDHGANIQTYSYWPYAYATYHNRKGVYDDVIDLLVKNGALTANMPNYTGCYEEVVRQREEDGSISSNPVLRTEENSMNLATGYTPEREIHVADIVDRDLMPDYLSGITKNEVEPSDVHVSVTGITDGDGNKIVVEGTTARSLTPLPTKSSIRVRPRRPSQGRSQLKELDR